MIKKIYSRHYSPRPMEKLVSSLYGKKLIIPIVAGLIFAAVVAGFTLISVNKKTKNENATKSLVFQRQLIGRNQYVAEIKGVMKTALGTEKQGGRVTISRGKSSLEFMIPIDNPTLNSQDVGILQATDVSFASKDKIISAKYNLIPNGIKEEIIMNKIPKQNSFPLSMKTTDLKIKLNPDGIPVFYDNAESYLFHFERPFVKDGAGNVSYGVRYRFVDQKNKNLELFKNKDGNDTLQKLYGNNMVLPNGEYFLIIEIDPDWLHDPKRVLPITIDPTVVHNTEAEFNAGDYNRSAGDTSQNVGAPTTELTGDANTVALYHLNEPANDTCSGGQDACDSSGNTNHGVANGTTINTSTQALGAASRNFNGSSHSVALANETNFDFERTSTFSIEAWIKTSSTALQTIVSKLDSNAPYPGYEFWVDDKGMIRAYLINDYDNDIYVNVGGSTWVADGNWHHVAMTYSGSSTAAGIKLYVDGVEETKTTYWDTLNATILNNVAVQIGSRNNNSFYFNGSIDEVIVTNDVRTAGEITADATRGPLVSSFYQELPTDRFTVGLWHMNEASGNAIDSSGNGNTGTASNTTVVAGQAGFGNARSFNGTNSYISTAIDTASNQLFATSGVSWTVEAWFKHAGGASGDQMIVGRGGGTGSGAVFGLYIDSANDLKTVIRGTQTVLRTDAADGLWHYAAVTWDGINLYGYFDNEGPITLTAGTAVIQTYNIDIGAQANSTSLYFNGLIDEVRVSNIARSFEDIELASSRRPYSTYTSDVIDLSRVYSWNSLAWTEIGMATGNGETLKDSNGLLAQWNLNETSGTTATNNAGSCGATCNGTLTNFASTGSQDAAAVTGWTANDRKWGAGALSFDGVDDFVDLGNNLDPGTGNYSVEYWAKMSQNSSNVWRTVQKRGTGATGTVFGFQISGAAGSFYNTYFIDTTGTNLANLSSTDYGVNDGQWHHVVVTFENITGNLKLYIDGKYKETGVKTGSPGGKTYSSSRNLTLGAAWDAAGTQSQFFNGTMDSVRIYNRVLPALEIVSNYNATSLEMQTRVGDSTNPDDGTWEAWRPTTSETQIEDFDSNTDSDGLDTVYIGDNVTNQTWIKKNNVAPSASDTTGTDGRIPLGTAGKVDVTYTYTPNVIKDGSTYKMWYGGYDGTNTRIAYATSPDGLTWTKYDNTIETPSDTTGTNGRLPLGTTGKGDAVNTFYPSVIKDGSTYKMWYAGRDGSTVNRIYYATSSDGLTWTKYDNTIPTNSDTTSTNGRIPLGTAGKGDSNDVNYPTVIKDNGTYKMWYGGYNGTNWRIYHATSPDGLTWTKYDNTVPAASDGVSTNGRIPLGTAGDSTHAYVPRVIKDGNVYKMWYGMHNGTVRIGYAISNDGLTWTKYNNAVPGVSDTTGTFGRLPVGNTGRGDVTHAFGATVIKDNGVYKMWYQGQDGSSTYRIYHASMAPLPLRQDLDANIKIEGTASEKITTGRISNIDAGTSALWHLDETGGSGAYIKDSTANANNGTPTGTSVVDGITRKARSFNGSSDRITIPAAAAGSLDIVGNAVTTSAWVYPTSLAGASQFIIARWVSYGMYTDSAGKVHCGGVNLSNWTGTTTLNVNNWYHIACVTNGASSKLYINGVLDSTGTLTAQTSNSNDVIVGARYNGTSLVYDAYFPGMIDEVSVSNTERTAEEIAESYRLGRGYYVNKTISSTDLSGKTTIPFYIAADRPGTYLQTTVGESNYANYQPDVNTLGLWHMEEAYGASGGIKDSTSYGRYGTVAGTTFTAGKIGKARTFAAGQDVSLGNISMVDGLANVTVDAWVYPTQQTAATHYRAFTEQLVLYVGHYGGQASFYMGNGTSWVVSDVTGGSLPINTWSHVTWVKDGTNYYIYINGRLSKSGTGAPATLGTTTNVNYISTYDGTNQPFIGAIDEMRISNVARSSEDARQVYEAGFRSHPITIDFAAKLDSGNLIADQNDTSFTIDATYYGLSNKGSKIFPGDKIIVRENYNGTEYIAQGTVSSVNETTGATTIVSWDSGYSFPPTVGFSLNASVFKWQREYWNITEPMDNHVNATTSFTLRLLDGNEGRTIWLDDLESGGDYLTNPTGSTIASSTYKRYMQYRVVEHSSSEVVSAGVTSVTLDYVQNSAPTTPTLDSPADAVTNQSLTPQLKTTSTDTNSDNLKYKIEMCTNLAMTTGCQTFDQTSSQTGWSGQNADTGTTYTSGTQATYTIQTPLNPNSTYYWRSYAIDPAGLNQWSTTQSPVRSFSTSQVPSAPILPYAEGSTNPTGVTDTTPEFSAVQSDPEGDSANYYRIQVNTQSDFLGTSMWDSGKTSMTTTVDGMRSPDISYAGSAIPLNGAGTTYYWRIKFWDVNGGEGLYTSAQSFTMNVKPGTPSLDSPTDTASNQSVALSFETTATDTNSDNLKYKIELCTNSAMTLNCQTFDQTVSQTGWSGQNADTNTTYTSGTQATYNIQAPLTPLFTYYWRSYAIDPTGSNTWSDTQATPYSFTTTSTDYPTTCRLEKASDNSSVTIKWSDNSTNEVNYELRKSTDGGAFSLLQTLSPNTISYLDSSVTNGHSYQYQVAAVFNGSQYSEWCTTSNITLGVGMLHLQGIDLK